MKFAVDKTLGRLAKWLRILGYDTVFDPYAPTPSIVNRAKEERRIFISRDAKLAKDPTSPELFIVHSERYQAQLREVVGHFKLDIRSKLFTRCTVCNEEILPVEKDTVKDVLPEKSALNYSSFYRCPMCKRVYWEGTHTENTKNRLLQIFPDRFGGEIE